jgi:hypothetical protein
MSKNIYRVNKKSDVDIIFKNNFLKPIFLIFVNDKTDKTLVNEIETTLRALSKKNTYSITLLINLDNFIDNMNFFNQYKENVPSFVSFFQGKQIAEYPDENNNNENFISIIVNIIEKINLSYVNKLITLFNEDDNTAPNNTAHNNSGPNNNTAPNNSGPNNNTAPNNTAPNNSGPNNSGPNNNTVPNNIMNDGSIVAGGSGAEDNDTDEIRLKKEKLKLLLKQKELLEKQK